MRISDWSSDVCSSDLILCEQSGQSALAACRQCYQTVSATFQHVEYNMRLFLNRAIKMSHGHQRTKIVIALCILGIKSEPIIDRASAVGSPRPRDTQH